MHARTRHRRILPIPCTRASARRVALGYAPPRQEEKQFFSNELQREYDEARCKYVSLKYLHNARDMGEGRKPRRDLYRRLSRRDVSCAVRCGVRAARANSFSSPRNFATSPENVTRLGPAKSQDRSRSRSTVAVVSKKYAL